MQGDAAEEIFSFFPAERLMLGKADEIWIRGRFAVFGGGKNDRPHKKKFKKLLTQIRRPLCCPSRQPKGSAELISNEL